MESITNNRNEQEFKWQPFLRQMLVCTIIWSIFFLFGLSLGTPTVTIPQLRKEANSTSDVSEEMASWIASICGYVGMVWVVVLALITHSYGRRKTVMLMTINAFVASLVLYCSVNAIYVLISQTLHGLTAASQTSISLMILTEYVSPRHRGIFLTIKSATLFWGIWAANAIGAFYNFRNIGICGMTCSLYSFIVLFIIPESPYWLASKEMYKECADSHRWLRGHMEQELQTLINVQKDFKRRRKQDKSVRDYLIVSFKNLQRPEMYKPVLLSLLVMGLYYFSGKLVCTIYSLQIIEKITGSRSTAITGMLLLDGFTVIGMYVGCGLSKILKRRTLLISASSIGTFLLYVTSFYMFLIKFSILEENNYITIGLLAAFSLALCCGPMMLSTSVYAEITPLRSRNFCFCLTSFFTKFLLGTVLKLSPLLFKSIGFHGAFLFFAVTSTGIITLIYIYLPETKDKSLHEIAEYFKPPNSKPVDLELLNINNTTQ